MTEEESIIDRLATHGPEWALDQMEKGEAVVDDNSDASVSYIQIEEFIVMRADSGRAYFFCRASSWTLYKNSRIRFSLATDRRKPKKIPFLKRLWLLFQWGGWGKLWKDEAEIVNRLLIKDREWALEQMAKGLVIRRLRGSDGRQWHYKLNNGLIYYCSAISLQPVWRVNSSVSSWYTYAVNENAVYEVAEDPCG